MLVTDSLLAYTLAATLLTLTPGLDTALILRTATAEGGRKALHAALGIDLGCFIWGALVAFGLGALLAVSELAYTIIEMVRSRIPLLAGHPVAPAPTPAI